ncbi:MAG: TauD/TfdA family dioxygenase, partial [bacterium]|nr:TauD/TfdA family dioxygenase [bacterium]
MERIANSLPADNATPQILIDEIKDNSAWHRDSLSPEDWLIPLPEACIAEFDAVAQSLRQHPRSIQSLTAEAFSLTACANMMSTVQANLQHQVGFAIVDRVPVERYSLTENKAIYWLLATLLGQVVSQKWDGTTLYDVKDSGKTLGYGVRRSVTTLTQDFHTDGGWLPRHPEIVGLFCLQPAQAGGRSRCVSLTAAHNEMRRQHVDLLARLYRPFFWDRQAEHGTDGAPFS